MRTMSGLHARQTCSRVSCCQKAPGSAGMNSSIASLSTHLGWLARACCFGVSCVPQSVASFQVLSPLVITFFTGVRPSVAYKIHLQNILGMRSECAYHRAGP